MESSIIDKPSLSFTDTRKLAEEYIDKVVAPRRRAEKRDRETAHARATLARENRELALRELKAGGLDPERLNALAEERSRVRRQLAEGAHRRAVEASAAAARRLVDLTPIILPAEPVDKMVDTVTFIRSFADQGVVIDSNVGPGDNWARYKFDASADAITESGTGRLSFFTLFQNPRGSAVILQAGTQLVVNAHLSTGADWGGVASWFFPDSEAQATVRARTTVWRMNSNVSSIVADRILGNAAAHGGFFGDDNDESIEFSDFLAATGVGVPSKEFVLIETEILTEWSALDGEVHFDAQSGDFKVTIPQLTITISDQ